MPTHVPHGQEDHLSREAIVPEPRRSLLHGEPCVTEGSFEQSLKCDSLIVRILGILVTGGSLVESSLI